MKMDEIELKDGDKVLINFGQLENIKATIDFIDEQTKHAWLIDVEKKTITKHDKEFVIKVPNPVPLEWLTLDI